MKSRLMAFALALLIGTPVCLCCVQAEAPVKKAARSCCEARKAKETPQQGSKHESCPCAGSMIQRDLAKNSVDVPPAVLTVPMVLETVEFVLQVIPVESGHVTLCNDTGPPHERTPIYLRQHALLL
ncbi:MAG: hypothetical protein WCN98_12890 [Verrucomicrobiaceae bacterium]